MLKVNKGLFWVHFMYCTYMENRVAFLGTDLSLRTNESFRNKSDEDYHKGDSPLVDLPVNVKDVVCLGYMHTAYSLNYNYNYGLGVMKRLIEF